MIYDLIVIGAGAGGCFAAIRLAEFHPGAKICILEAARKPLSKVEISGGGRCNVTHACYDPEKLTTYYPRGQDQLLKPFQKFQPADLVEWFSKKGVKLKTESDGRMFPITDLSSTIINCFLNEIRKKEIQLLTSTRASSWNYDQENKCWKVTLMDGQTLSSSFLLISSGSDQRIWNFLQSSGHNIISPVPSLFTFNIKDKALNDLMGISKNEVTVSIPKLNMSATGPLLITHWGMSGPAILRLSAWGARELYNCGYVFDLAVRWVGKDEMEPLFNSLQERINENPKKKIHNLAPENFPSRLWTYMCEKAEIPPFTTRAEFGKKQIKRLSDVLSNDVYRVTGKSTFKEEFVTAGGVDLDNIDMQKFESKISPGLFLVGEVLNIDAITGGFNFQAAWTGGHIAAEAIASRL